MPGMKGRLNKPPRPGQVRPQSGKKPRGQVYTGRSHGMRQLGTIPPATKPR